MKRSQSIKLVLITSTLILGACEDKPQSPVVANPAPRPVPEFEPIEPGGEIVTTEPSTSTAPATYYGSPTARNHTSSPSTFPPTVYPPPIIRSPSPSRTSPPTTPLFGRSPSPSPSPSRSRTFSPSPSPSPTPSRSVSPSPSPSRSVSPSPSPSRSDSKTSRGGFGSSSSNHKSGSAT